MAYGLGGRPAPASENLPREFVGCGACGKRGAYRVAPVVVPDGYGGLAEVAGEMVRCKYCRLQAPLVGDLEGAARAALPLMGRPS